VVKPTAIKLLRGEVEVSPGDGREITVSPGEGKAFTAGKATIFRRIEGDVVEKQRAREIYETILREKRDPGLLEWTGGNLFKARDCFPWLLWYLSSDIYEQKDFDHA